MFPVPNIPIRPAAILSSLSSADGSRSNSSQTSHPLGRYGINIGPMIISWLFRFGNGKVELLVGKAIARKLKKERKQQRKDEKRMQKEQEEKERLQRKAERRRRREERKRMEEMQKFMQKNHADCNASEEQNRNTQNQDGNDTFESSPLQSHTIPNMSGEKVVENVEYSDFNELD